jgi:hypothetical protein
LATLKDLEERPRLRSAFKLPGVIWTRADEGDALSQLILAVFGKRSIRKTRREGERQDEGVGARQPLKGIDQRACHNCGILESPQLDQWSRWRVRLKVELVH